MVIVIKLNKKALNNIIIRYIERDGSKTAKVIYLSQKSGFQSFCYPVLYINIAMKPQVPITLTLNIPYP